MGWVGGAGRDDIREVKGPDRPGPLWTFDFTVSEIGSHWKGWTYILRISLVAVLGTVCKGQKQKQRGLLGGYCSNVGVPPQTR